MGYTHYWTSRGFTGKKWSQLTSGTTAIIARAKRSGIEVAGSDSEGTVQVTDLRIAFNGPRGAACEPFKLSRTAGRGFCKTEQLPYDAVVVAVLIAAEATGALTWTSDGRDEDHAAGRRLAEGNE
jgi:hypothetical protein